MTGYVASGGMCRLENQIVAKRYGLVHERDLLTDCMACGAELPSLIELTVIGQISLGNNAQHATAVDDDRTVEQTVFESQRRPDQKYGRQIPTGMHDLSYASEDSVQQGILLEQIVDCIRGDAQLGKQSNGRACFRRLRGQTSRASRVEFRVRYPYVGKRRPPRAQSHGYRWNRRSRSFLRL